MYDNDNLNQYYKENQQQTQDEENIINFDKLMQELQTAPAHINHSILYMELGFMEEQLERDKKRKETEIQTGGDR